MVHSEVFRRHSWRLNLGSLGDALGERTWIFLNLHLETELGFAGRCAWRQHSSLLGDTLGD